MTRLARLARAGNEILGALTEDSYIDVTRAYALALAARGVSDARAQADTLLPADIARVLATGPDAVAAIRVAVDYADRSGDATLRIPTDEAVELVPIASPPKIVCVARNYRDHAEEAGLPVSDIPILFARFANSQVAHKQPVLVPAVSHQVDWEGELAVVIGKRGRRVPRAEAFSYVGGYTVFNDVSIRDYQFRVTQYTEGKNFLATAPIGPVIVLTDEDIDPHQLRVTTKVNGVLKQDGSTSELIFDIPTLISHISEFTELEPGDVIATGTPAGVGFKRTPPEFLADGDTVEVEIDGIGVLRNPVQHESRFVPNSPG